MKVNPKHIINKEEEKLYIQKLKNSDDKALEYFFNQYYKYLVVTAYNILHDDFRAKDIVQDVFFRLWEKRAELKIQDMKPYLRRAVYNKAIDHIRKIKRQGGWTEEITDISHPVVSRTVLDEIAGKELQQRINKAINLLPNKCKTVFCLSRLENLSHKEIAAQLDISVKTIENQMTKALKIMRKHLLSIVIIVIFLLNIIDL